MCASKTFAHLSSDKNLRTFQTTKTNRNEMLANLLAAAISVKWDSSERHEPNRNEKKHREMGDREKDFRHKHGATQPIK